MNNFLKMKKNIIFGIFGLAIGLAIGAMVFGSNVKYKNMVKNARLECIKYNKEYNEIYDAIFKNYFMDGGERYKLAALILQNDFPFIMAINKALDIDCREYDENGEVIMAEQKNGEQQPMEHLPNELRIMKGK